MLQCPSSPGMRIHTKQDEQNPISKAKKVDTQQKSDKSTFHGVAKQASSIPMLCTPNRQSNTPSASTGPSTRERDLHKLCTNRVTHGRRPFAIAIQTSRHSNRLARRETPSPIAVEDHGDLFQAVPLGLGVVEESGQTKDRRDEDVHDVVFPADRSEGDRVDESVEEDGADGRQPGDGETARAQLVGPDFAGVRG